jgi:ubiquinone/menaquinone biosynthesis C-methylase UbiE
MITAMAGFDPETYKRTTTEQWQAAAPKWAAWTPVLEDWLGAATERMLDLAGVSPGSRVLDVAAGAGGQSLAAPRRVGPEGSVLATDIASNILEYAAEAARAEGLTNLTTQVADGEEIGVEPAQFDAVISRLGLMFFPDRARALAGMRQALRPGGRLAAIAYTTPERNAFFSTPITLVRERTKQPPPSPGQPGPFSLGATGVFEAELLAAGFTDVIVEAFDAPVRLPDAKEYTRFARESFGALHQMMSGLDEDAQEAIWSEVENAMSRYEGPAGFAGPCELLIGAGTKA